MEPINNRGYQEYNRIAGSKKPVNDEKFTLDPSVAGKDYERGREGVVYEPSSGEKKDVSDASGSATNNQSTSTSSNSGRSTVQGVKKVESAESTFNSGEVLAKIKDLFIKVFDSIKNAFSRIWNSPDNNNANTDRTGSVEADIVSTGANVDKTDENGTNEAVSALDTNPGMANLTEDERIEAIRENRRQQAQGLSNSSGLSSERAGNLAASQVQSSTDGQIPRVARNTSLLTQYNSRGQIVVPDASDQQRILHGDRGVRNKRP